MCEYNITNTNNATDKLIWNAFSNKKNSTQRFTKKKEKCDFLATMYVLFLQSFTIIYENNEFVILNLHRSMQ